MRGPALTRLSGRRFNHSRQQLIPGTLERLVNTQNRGDQDVDVACFDLLHRANVEISPFCQLLLSHIDGRSFTSDIRPELLELRGYGALPWHAPLRRMNGLDRNGVLRRKI